MFGIPEGKKRLSQQRIKQGVLVGILTGIIIVVWEIGWLCYDLFSIWNYFINTTYQAILLTIIGGFIVLFMYALTKVKEPLTNLDKQELNKLFNQAVEKIIPDVEQLKESTKFLTEEYRNLQLAFKIKPDELTQIEKKVEDNTNRIRRVKIITEKHDETIEKLNQKTPAGPGVPSTNQGGSA